MINYILNKKNKKITLRNLQQMCGYLNFLGKCIVPGRAFTRRMYAHGKNLTKKDHHLYVGRELRLDLQMWLIFLEELKYSAARPFFHFDNELTSQELNFYTDASFKGCGGICNNEWFIKEWEDDLFSQKNWRPSINYLELYALTIGVFLWISKYENRKITIFCNNQSVMHMVNTTTSSCPNCMVLIRLIALETMRCNVKLTVKYVTSASNTFADLLSRLEYKKFKQLSKATNKSFTNRPSHIPINLENTSNLLLPIQLQKSRKRKDQHRQHHRRYHPRN